MRSRAQLRAEQDRLLDLVPDVRSRLRHIPVVHSVGVGAKEVGGEVTDDFAFRVYVDLKLPLSELPADQRIPRQIHGIPTDVLTWTKSQMILDLTRHRPLKGGAQIRNEFVKTRETVLLAGTLGCLVQLNVSTRDVMALSCEHVLLGAQASIGAVVAQPRYVVSCCCCPFNRIGKVFAARKNANVDCGIVQLDDDNVQEITAAGMLNQVLQIGALAGVAAPVCFEHVRKRGRTTDLTEGRVLDVLYDGSQILIQPTVANPQGFAEEGDSGAVVVNDANRVVGLLWATDFPTRRLGVANHIGEVMRELNILIAGQTHTGLTLPTTPCGPPPP